MLGKRRLSEIEKMSSRSKSDPRQYEKEAFIDRINEINFAIKEFQKLYERSPVTDNLFHSKVLKQIERSKRTLSKIQTEYEIFKKYKNSNNYNHSSRKKDIIAVVKATAS
jgi:hypothetical protein